MPEMDVALKDTMQIEGAIGAALVDHSSGMALGTAGGGKGLFVYLVLNKDRADLAMARHRLRAVEQSLDM